MKREKARGDTEKRPGITCPCIATTAGPATRRGERGDETVELVTGGRRLVLTGVNGRGGAGGARIALLLSGCSRKAVQASSRDFGLCGDCGAHFESFRLGVGVLVEG